MNDVSRERLPTARKIADALRASDLCPKQIAAIFDIIPTSIRNLLNAKTDVTFSRLIALARLTHRTIESFSPDDIVARPAAANEAPPPPLQ